MEINLELIWKLLAGLYMFCFALVPILYLWIRSEINNLQEALALTIASDPSLAKNVANLIKENKTKVKTKKEVKL